VTYAVHVCNNTPTNGVCPADVITGSTVPRHRLMDVHVWGCPLYVLDPKIQQGQKLPRWEPRSRRGIFLGLSQQYASEVPLVLNLGTGAITNQFHVVFADLFTAVPSIERDIEPPDHWADLCLENSTHIMVDSPIEHLGDEWLNEEELELKRRRQNRDELIREATEQRYTGIPGLHLNIHLVNHWKTRLQEYPPKQGPKPLMRNQGARQGQAPLVPRIDLHLLPTQHR
jgi:hypothetical protein